MSLASTAQSSVTSSPIFLFRLDASSVGAGIYYLVQAMNEDGTPISFGGQVYTPVDLETEGFETNADGSLPSPILRIANTDGIIQALVNQYGDLAGCNVRRVRTFAEFLDGQPGADPTSYVGPDVFRVERKTDENDVYLEWELSPAFDQEGMMLPGRTYLRDVCTRRYRRYEPTSSQAHPDGFVYSLIFPCPYTASPCFTADGVPTTAQFDRCGRKDSDCRLRFGEDGVLPFGGFPGIGRAPS